MHVPFLDLRAHHEPIRQELLAAFSAVIDQNAFAGGPFVEKFETEFAAYCQTRYAIGVGNGTDALWLALLAAGVRPGDEVITAPATFIATAEAISLCGATPVFVDIDEVTYTLDPGRVERSLTSKTKAIVPVHLYGQPAAMDDLLAVAQQHGLPVVEDSCQAHGAEYRGRRTGSLGLAGCFSFYPGKNLGALGEAGAITTNDAALAAHVRMLREHGSAQRYVHRHIGWNARMDGLQAAALSLKLPRLDAGNAARQRLAERYHRNLAGTPGISLPGVAPDRRSVHHLFVVRVPERDRLLRALSECGIQAAIHYPRPVHLQEAYAFLGHAEGSFPIAERCAREVLSLPLFPEMTDDQVDYVSQALHALVAGPSAAIAAER